MARDDSSDDEERVVEPVSSFQSLFAEGDILAKQGSYKKAIVAFTKALAMKVGDKDCHVARSQCYLRLGDPESALIDANMSLKEDSFYFRGVFQKAEALYAKGDFEMALVFYHRGNKMRPEQDKFRLGIQKAREAIDNSIGNPKDYKVKAPPGIKISATGEIILPHASDKKGLPHAAHAREKSEDKTSGQNAKQLLGELYADKEYLEDFQADKDFEHNPNSGIMNLVTGCLHYLEARTEFWRQQKPIYARKKEHSVAKARAVSARNRALIEEKAQEHKNREAMAAQEANNPKAGGGVRCKSANSEYRRNRFTAETEKYVTASMNVVTRSMEKGDHQRALQAARSLLTRLNDIANLPNRERAISDVISMIGNIYMDLGCLPQAMQFYRKDLQHCKSYNLRDSLTRALGNMGRICVKLRRFEDAILAFEKKLTLGGTAIATSQRSPSPETAPGENSATVPSVSSETSAQPTLERAWLLHDIGRCHLELGRDDKARQLGISSLKVAQAVKDPRWCLNALVLIGQVEVRLEKFDAALKVYTKSLQYANELKDPRAILAITEALDQLRSKLPTPPPPPQNTVSSSLLQQQQNSGSKASKPPSTGGIKLPDSSQPSPQALPPVPTGRPKSATPSKQSVNSAVQPQVQGNTKK